MAETRIDRVRAQTEAVCAEVDEFESKARAASPESRISYEERLTELSRRCETLESKLADIEWSEESWGDLKSRLLGALEGAKRRLKNLQAEPTARESDGGAGPDVVCTDELDATEERNSGSLEGTVLSVGGAVAGLTPLESPPEPRREETAADEHSGESPDCGECR
jgi:exonuclease VII small subunit